MKHYNNVGKIIYKQRKKKNLTQAELAEKLHVSDRAVSNWETDKNLPDRTIINNLSIILDYDFISLISDKPVNKKERIIKSSIFIGIILIMIIIDIVIINLKSYPIYFLSSPDIDLGNSYIVIGKNNTIVNIDNLEIDENKVVNFIIYKDEDGTRKEVFCSTEKNSIDDSNKELDKIIKKGKDELYIEVMYYRNGESYKKKYKLLLENS